MVHAANPASVLSLTTSTTLLDTPQIDYHTKLDTATIITLSTVSSQTSSSYRLTDSSHT